MRVWLRAQLGVVRLAGEIRDGSVGAGCKLDRRAKLAQRSGLWWPVVRHVVDSSWQRRPRAPSRTPGIASVEARRCDERRKIAERGTAPLHCIHGSARVVVGIEKRVRGLARYYVVHCRWDWGRVRIGGYTGRVCDGLSRRGRCQLKTDAANKPWWQARM